MKEHKRKLLAAYKSSNFHTFEEYLIDRIIQLEKK